jgi:hypothetical protein
MVKVLNLRWAVEIGLVLYVSTRASKYETYMSFGYNTYALT